MTQCPMCSRQVTETIPTQDEGNICARCYDNHLDMKFAIDGFPMSTIY